MVIAFVDNLVNPINSAAAFVTDSPQVRAVISSPDPDSVIVASSGGLG